MTSQPRQLTRFSPRWKNLAVGSAAVVALAACAASPVKVESEWAEGAERDQSFQRVLVVGVSPEYNTRCAFEAFMAGQLRTSSTAAVTSCSKMKSTDPLTRESIEKVIVATRADSVLATALVDSSAQAREGGTSETQGDVYFKPTGYGFYDPFYGPYGMPVVYGEFKTTPSITTVEGQVDVATRLYDTRDASLVYSVKVHAEDLESRGEGMAEIIGPTAEHLKSVGLVR